MCLRMWIGRFIGSYWSKLRERAVEILGDFAICIEKNALFPFASMANGIRLSGITVKEFV